MEGPRPPRNPALLGGIGFHETDIHRQVLTLDYSKRCRTMRPNIPGSASVLCRCFETSPSPVHA